MKIFIGTGGILLKFCKNGEPVERHFFVTPDFRYVQWKSNFWAFKSIKNTRGSFCFSDNVHFYSLLTHAIIIFCFCLNRLQLIWSW